MPGSSGKHLLRGGEYTETRLPERVVLPGTPDVAVNMLEVW